MKKKVIVFISGKGSNMVSLIRTSKQIGYPAEIIAVICNNPHATGIKKAQNNNLPVHVIDHKNYLTRKEHEESILNTLAQYQPDFICLAGYMRLISPYFIKAYEGRILNIHPSLLPLFKGLNPHKKALEAGVRITGCTVHLVTEEMDSGKILAQAAVPVHPRDTVESLTQRVLKAEHVLYPEALKAFIQGHNETTNYQQQLLSV